ncbi:MAG: AAC(3) family N-acetyltransferase [Victivallaceae bacterium]
MVDGKITKDIIIRDFLTLGICSGDTILLHSSLKSLGRVEGGADTVIDALLELLGEEGALLMPSFQSGSEFYLVDRGCIFDVRTSPSELGIITETFRKRPGVIRSLNPTHSTAGTGKQAAQLLSGHEKCQVSCGFGSPYCKIIQAHGKIVLLGVGHQSNTTLHFVENTNGAPTVCSVLYQPEVIDSSGNKIVVPTYPHMPKLGRDFSRVEPYLLEAGLQINGCVGQAETRVINAYGMNQLIGGIIRQNPMLLIVPFNPGSETGDGFNAVP